MTTSTKPEMPATFEMPKPSAEFLDSQRVASRLVELMNAGKSLDAIKELYSDNASHVEVMEAPWCPRVITGKPALLKKAEEFYANMDIHGASVGTPIVNGDQFLLPMSLDATAKTGPMAGHRMDMTETALYTVKNGKITEAKFFYGMCGG